MAEGFNGFVDSVGYSVGSPSATAIGFDGLLDFVGYGVGKVSGGFPAQFAGLRIFYSAAVRELCLVAEADAPPGMGGVIKINKNGTNYVVYLVETADPNASSVRVKTSTGIKSVRLKT